MNVYDVGDQVRLSVCFTDSDGQAVDPTVVGVMWADSLGLVTELVYDTDAAVVRDATGEYYVDLVANRAGTWLYRWESSGTVTAATEGAFEVRRSSF